MATPTFILPSAPTYTEGFVNGLNVYPNPTNFVANQVPFTRATTATRTNAAGLIELVPYNLVTWSEQFDNATWVKNASSVTANSAISPSGIQNADTLTADGTLNFHTIIQSGSATSGVTYTHSIYAKKNTNNFIQLFGTGTIYTTATIFANFDLNLGVVGSVGVGATATITDVGNGWFRCTMTATATFTTTGGVIIPCLVSSATSPRAEANTLTTSVFIWGAQLVEGTDALPYQLTETRLNRPRVDFSLGGCPNLLLEPQRTNLVTWSEDLTNAAWTKLSSTITANSTTSPSGIANADTFLADGTSSSHLVQTNSISVVSGTTYTSVIYAKKNTNNFLQIISASSTGGMFANFDLNNGVVGSVGTITGSNPTSSITNVGNGWYRCTMTYTPNATTSAVHSYAIVSSASAARVEINSLSTSVFLWGAQIELGAFPTTYIPTTSASVTRNADSFQLSNVFTNNLISSAGGTWFVEVRNNLIFARDNSNRFGIADTSALSNDGITISTSSSTGRLQIQKRIATVLTSLYVTTTDTCKIAIKWNGATADIFENGVKVVSATAFTPTIMEFLATNTAGTQVPVNINSMALYNTPISDAECIAITTL
jgi:hypothetical protein